MQKYMCNVCGKLHSLFNDAALCHPDVVEVDDNNLPTRAAELQRAPVQTEQTGSYTVCTICGKKNGEHDQSIHVAYERSLSKRSVGW